MKKIWTLMLLAAAACGTASAQQLTNADFEGDWVNCYPWEKGACVTTAYGTQPIGWKISNVPNSLLGALAEQVDGKEGNGVKLTNNSAAGNSVPAYLELGTPWATAETKLTSTRNQDGGSFGGIEFTYKPDAVSFDFKREKETGGDVLTLVAYLWKGTWTQNEVPSNTAVSFNFTKWGSATKVNMTDRDVNILGKDYTLGGAVSKTPDAELIASLEQVSYSKATDWTTMEVSFDYKNASATPEKMNIIIANTDYFGGQDKVVSGSTLTIDNVNLVYWNTLSSLKYDGKDILKDGQTDYDMSTVAYDVEKLQYAAKSQFASVDLSYDEETMKATLIVKRENAEDNTYTIQFGEGKTGTDVTYTKDIIVTIDGSSVDPQPADIVVTYYDDNTIDFTLKNFILADVIPVGNIAIKNLPIENGKFSFNDGLYIEAGDMEGKAEEDWLGPQLAAMGPLPLELSGEINDEDKFFYVNIDIDLTDVMEQVVNVQAGDPIPAKLTLTEAKAGTFVAPFPVTIPVDEETEEPLFTASTVTGIQNGYLVLSPCDDVIPAKTPVVIQGEANEFNFAIIKNREYVEPTPSTSGLLTGIYAPTTVPVGSYVLQKQDKVAFFKVTGDFTLGANRCYLTIPQGNSARAIYFGEDILTALNAAVTTNVSNTIYDLQGRRVNNADQKGVFIVNGKKVVK